MADIVYKNISDLTEIDSAEAGTFAAVETNNQGKKIDLSQFATKTEVNTGLAAKQDAVPDLAAIREGAEAGSTAVQPAALEQYQKALTPGENITIVDNVISSTGGSVTAGTDMTVENGVVSVNTVGTATGTKAFVIGGTGNEASGDQSFAGGLKAKAKGEESFAFGNESVAGGKYSEAHGYKQYSVSTAELDENGTLDGNANGYITKDIKVKWSDVKADAESINGSYQAGEGAATYGAKHVVFGARSEAHCNQNLVTGRDSEAHNSNNEVYGNYAHAEGRGNQCWGNAQSVLGKYCDPKREEGVGDNSPYLEIVGNGSSNSARSNARTLDKQGNERLAGKVYPNNGTESYDDMIAELETGLNNKANVSDMNSALAGKQDTIDDLEDIRTGAAAGAAAYNKPADGIPASDLAETVQSALVKIKPDWDAEAGSDAEILNKPVIPAKGYTRKTLTVRADEDGNRIFNFNVNDRESLIVNLEKVSSASTTVHIHLSDDCDDAIILLNAPKGYEAGFIACYRGDTELISIRQLVHNLDNIPYLLRSIRQDGSGIGVPTDWSEVDFASGNVAQNNGYKILYNVDIGSDKVKKMLVRIVADYAFIYPVEFDE